MIFDDDGVAGVGLLHADTLTAPGGGGTFAGAAELCDPGRKAGSELKIEGSRGVGEALGPSAKARCVKLRISTQVSFEKGHLTRPLAVRSPIRALLDGNKDCVADRRPEEQYMRNIVVRIAMDSCAGPERARVVRGAKMGVSDIISWRLKALQLDPHQGSLPRPSLPASSEAAGVSVPSRASVPSLLQITHLKRGTCCLRTRESVWSLVLIGAFIQASTS